MPRQDPSRSSAARDRATLLVFTLGARRERARRRLLPERLGAWELALHRDCLAAALEAGQANGCRLTVCAPRRLPLAADAEQFLQQGRDFGDRLRRAVARQRPTPERPLVIVGSDVPGIRPSHVSAALASLRLEPRRLVVGPSPDGGFYLLAAARPLDPLLAEVVWLRRDTLASLLAAAAARGLEVTLLAPLADLDRTADLESWLARRPGAAFSWLPNLLALLRLLRRPLRPVLLGHPRPGWAPIPPGRGPPG